MVGGTLITGGGCATKRGTGAAGGAAAGGLLGYEVGRRIEQEDRRRMAYAHRDRPCPEEVYGTDGSWELTEV